VEDERLKQLTFPGELVILLTLRGCKGVWLQGFDPLLCGAWDKDLADGVLIFWDGGFLTASVSAFNVALMTSVASLNLS
jgi:hypothetical protein